MNSNISYLKKRKKTDKPVASLSLIIKKEENTNIQNKK